MRWPIEEMAAGRWDAPADRRDGGAAMGCAGRSKRPNRQGMRRPSETKPNRWRLGNECAGKRSNTKSVDRRRMRRQTKQHQIVGGSGANAPANKATPNRRWIRGECAGKQSNTKSVDRQQMRRQKKQHQIGGSGANAPAKEATPNWWIGGECAGKRSNTKLVDRRRMRRQKKQHQIGVSASNAPANKEIVARQWDAPAG
jgi:hypothetical protein